MLRRVLDHHQHGASPLTAHADALEDAQQHEECRRPKANLGVSRQAANQEGADPHDEHGQREHRLAPDPVAEMAKDHPAEGPSDEADCVGAEGSERPGHGIEGRKEDLIEHESSGGAVDQEVVPLDDRPNDARPEDAPHLDA